jgi:hypothetical protein
MSQLTAPPEVRTGRCSLVLVIDGRRYRLSPAPPTKRGAKIWRLNVCPGQTRAGKTYAVCSFNRHVDCTCPDSVQNHAICKHVRALQVLGLVAKTAKACNQLAWENMHPTRRRKPCVPRLSGEVHTPAGPAEDPPRKLAAARRRHTPIFANPATMASGWNDAVRAHIAALATSQTGVNP